MVDVRKVRPSAGAEWLLGGFGLLRKSPFGLGLLGAIFGVIAMVGATIGMRSPTLLMVQQVVMLLLGPLLIAGMIWAAREVDEGRSANPSHLLRGIHDHKAGRLWMTLLPQIAAGLVVVVLLFVLVGPGELQKMMIAVEQAQGQAQPDPAMFKDFPFQRLLLWLVLAIVVGVGAGFFTFTAIPDMMFRNVGAIESMKRSFRACVSNLPALIVFFVLLVITIIALSIAVNIVGFMVKLAAGETAMLFVVQVLMMAVLLPVVTGAMYYAWKQIVAGSVPVQAADNAVVEA